MRKKLLFAAFLMLTITAFGQKLPFQGKLIETGAPVDGTRTLEFSIASQSWSETHTDVPITDGLYFVVLGSISPLPDSLFYGVDEQSLDISVDGTALSPVILFKPLSSPFEGSELVVKNDEDTIVGSLANNTDSQSGQLEVRGPNGNLNALIGSHYLSANQGSIQIFDEEGNPKAILYSRDKNTTFNLSGEKGLTLYTTSFINPNGHESNRFNLRAMNFPAFLVAMNSYQDGAGDTLVTGTQLLQRKNLSTNVIDLKTELKPDASRMYHNNRLLSQSVIHDWGGNGYSGLFQLLGPNTVNIEMGGRFWNNSDIPYFKMHNSQDQYALELSLSEDSNETAYMNLNSLDGSSTSVNAGSIGLRGPNSTNINMGSRPWEGNPDLPYLHMFGTNDGNNDFNGIEISILPDGNGDQRGFINLYSQDGRSSNIGSGSFGLRGTNSQNIDMGSKEWEDKDFGYINMWGRNDGQNDFHAMEIAVSEDGNGDQFGYINLMSENGKSLRLSPNGFNMEGVSMSSTENPNGNGWYGVLNVSGPNSSNTTIGSRYFDNPDLPFINLGGSTGQSVLYISATPDADEAGHIKMSGDNDNYWVVYSASGISSSGPLSISTGVNITGDVVVNGVTEHTSDRRFKKNIQSISPNTLEKIQLIEGVSYNWRQDEFPDKNFSSDKQIGLIAQELEAQFPELVKTNKDGYKSVNYNGFTAVLLEAVKELNAKVEKLENENMQLKAELSASVNNTNEIDQLKNQMETLTKMVMNQNSQANNQLIEATTSTPGLK